jgi:hypothetical protein
MPEHTTLTRFKGRVLRFTVASVPSPARFQAEFLDVVDAELDAQHPFSLIIDTTAVRTPSFETTNLVMGWMARNRARLAHLLRSSAIIIRSKLVRGVLNTVFVVQKPVAPMITVDSQPDAFVFTRQHMVPEA